MRLTPPRRLFTVATIVVTAMSCSSGGAPAGRDGAAPDPDRSGSSTRPGVDASTTSTTASTQPIAIASKRLSPVGVGEPATLLDGVTIRVVSSERRRITATGPGEVGGMGIFLVVEVVNRGGGVLDLSGFAITARDLAGTPLPPSRTAIGGLSGVLEPGERTEGRYAFRAPDPPTGGVELDIQHFSAENVPVVVIDGQSQ